MNHSLQNGLSSSDNHLMVFFVDVDLYKCKKTNLINFEIQEFLKPDKELKI